MKPTEPGPQLDALVMGHVFKARRTQIRGRDVWVDESGNVITGGDCSPSSDRTDTGLVIDKLASEGKALRLTMPGFWDDNVGQAVAYEAEFTWLGEDECIHCALEVSSISDSHAICLAGLKARGGRSETD